MSDKVVVSIKDFLDLINATAATTYKGKDDPMMSHTYLASARGDHPNSDTGDDIDLLVATSGDGVIAGQITIPAEGQFSIPLPVDFRANGHIVSTLKNAQKGGEKGSEHTVEMTLTKSTGREPHRLMFQTLTDGVKSDTDSQLIVNVPLMEYNIREVMKDLDPKPVDDIQGHALKGIDDDGQEVTDTVSLPDAGLVGIDSSSAGLLSAIEKVFGVTPLVYFVGHKANRRVVTCGEYWRGTIPGAQFDPDVADGPAVELVELRSEEDLNDDPEQGPTEDGLAEEAAQREAAQW